MINLKGLNTLTRSAVATPKKKSAQQSETKVKKQGDKSFPQIQYKTMIQSYLFMASMDILQIMVQY